MPIYANLRLYIYYLHQWYYYLEFFKTIICRDKYFRDTVILPYYHYDRTDYRKFEKAKPVDEEEEEEPSANSAEIESFSPMNFGVCIADEDLLRKAVIAADPNVTMEERYHICNFRFDDPMAPSKCPRKLDFALYALHLCIYLILFCDQVYRRNILKLLEWGFSGGA